MENKFQWQLSFNGNKSSMAAKVPMATQFQWKISSNGNLVSMSTKVPMATQSQWQQKFQGQTKVPKVQMNKIQHSWFWLICNMGLFLTKFIYSEKVTKIWRNPPLSFLTLLSNVKTLPQNFEVFSQNLNLTLIQKFLFNHF